MSASTSSDKCEPNLTPLLDMVLQLVMFFMLCANFVMEQVNESVKLPLAIVIEVCTKSHIIKPLRANSGYGTSFVSKLANLLNKIVKIAVVKTGCKTAHATPIAVCL